MSEFFIYIDYIGTIVFAITGASIACRLKFDFFGMLFLAFLTAVGGGTVRDLIISQPVFWTKQPIYLYLILLSTVSTFFMFNFFVRKAPLLLFLDTIGVGTFVVIGTYKTLDMGFNSETALIMGTISAVLGGILRSAFSHEHSILANRELYATVAAGGSLIFIILFRVGLDLNINALCTISLTLVIRYLSIRLKLQVPTLKV